jgi:hypothetical protein
MACQQCGSDRIILVSGKCSDCCVAEYKGFQHIGYVPCGVGIEGGDYVELRYCLQCGRIQGDFPMPDPPVGDSGEWENLDGGE